MRTGTSPGISQWGDGYQIAYQGTNSDLNILDSSGNNVDHPLGMMAGTSPSLYNQYAVFQANVGILWTTNTRYGDTHLGMMSGTNPSVACEWEVAFQANTGSLWTYSDEGSAGSGSRGYRNWNLGMSAGTSPSITVTYSLGGAEIAFQANSGDLWTVGQDNSGDSGLGMMAGTSPSIAGLSDGGYEVAAQASDGELWTLGTYSNGDMGVQMMAGTSPSIAAE